MDRLLVDANVTMNAHHGTNKEEEPPDVTRSQASDVSKTSRDPHTKPSENASLGDGVNIEAKARVRCRPTLLS